MTTETDHIPSREKLETGKLFAEMMNLLEDTRKKEDERVKIRTETKWHPLVVGAGLFSAGAVFFGAMVGGLLALAKWILR